MPGQRDQRFKNVTSGNAAKFIPDRSPNNQSQSSTLQFKFDDTSTGIRYYTQEVIPSKQNQLCKQLDEKRKQRLQKRLTQLSQSETQFGKKEKISSGRYRGGGSNPDRDCGSGFCSSSSSISRFSRKGVLLEGVADDSSHYSDDQRYVFVLHMAQRQITQIKSFFFTN